MLFQCFFFILFVCIFFQLGATPPPLPGGGVIERQIEKEYEAEPLSPEKKPLEIQIDVPQEQLDLPDGVKVFICHVKVHGNDSIPSSEIERRLASKIHCDLALSDIYEICRCIEALFELGTAPADLPLLSLCYKTGQVNKRIAQAIQHQWKEVLGFNIQIEQLDPKIHMERLHQRNHQIAIASWIAQFHDPVNLLERYRLRSNPKNFSNWYHPDFEALITQAEATIDPKQRLGLLAQAEEFFALDMPILPLYHWTAPSLSSPRIRDIPRTPSGGILFERFVLLDRK